LHAKTRVNTIKAGITVFFISFLPKRMLKP